MPVISFEHVDVIFGTRANEAITLLDRGEGRDKIADQTGSIVAVNDASLFVEQGEILVLMGLSGSGKSSLLRCVNGLNKITRGHLYLNLGGGSVDLANCSTETLQELRRNKISMVFQQFGLMPWLNVRDNVGFGLHIRGVKKGSEKAIIDEKLALVQLDRWANKFPHELSGGMQQRVGLARALATEPDILLMDEPFSALDPLIREKLQDELVELQKRVKKTIIFVSHDLNEALKIGSRIAIMESGKVIQFGRPSEIVLHPKNDYVRQFVASMNPLTVLRGEMLMRPLVDCVRQGNKVMLDQEWCCILDQEGRPQFCEKAGKSSPSFIVSPDYPMREAISNYQSHAQPILVCDGERKMLGVIGATEIYNGLLRSGAST